MMEELNILESNTGETKMQLCTVVKIFCMLLLMVLLSDSTFTRCADHLFDLLLIPIAEPPNAAYIKSKGNISDVENTAKNALNQRDFSNPASPYNDKAPLLTEVAFTSPSLMLEDNCHPDSIDNVQEFPMLVMADESSMPKTIPQSPSVVLKESVVTPNNTIQNPLPEPIAQEITVAGSKLPDSVILEEPSDTNIQADTKLPSDIQNDSKFAVSDITQDSTEISAENTMLQKPVAQESLPDETQTPNGNIVDPIISESSSAPPLTPEMTEPDSTVSDVTTPSDIEDIETGSGEAIIEAPSCFLLDEAGMLYGFLPEYAEISDGCLTLPAECTGIRSGAFSGVGFEISELYLPAGATMIENGALIGLDSLVWIDIEGANPVYTSINGVLFDNTTTKLLSFPAGRTDAYSLPEHVLQIAAGAFTNTSLSRLDFRRCSSLFLEGNIFGASTGDGIVIAVPAESLPVYEEIFNTYAVILTI